LAKFELTIHLEDDLIHIEKWHPDHPISCVYYDPERDLHFVKRFLCEVTSDKMVSFLPEAEGARMDVVSTAYRPKVNIVFNKLLKATKNLPDKEVEIADFIDIKGMKAIGNQLTKLKTKEIQLVGPIEGEEPWPIEEPKDQNGKEEVSADDEAPFEVEWDMTKDDQEEDDEESGQAKLF